MNLRECRRKPYIQKNQNIFITTIKHNKNMYITQQRLEVLIGLVTGETCSLYNFSLANLNYYKKN